MQSSTIYSLIAAGVLLILLLYVYFGKLRPASEDIKQARGEIAELEETNQQLEQRAAGLEEKLSVEAVTRIHFESGSAYLADESKSTLEGIVQRLRGAQNTKIRVVGHTDDQMVIPDFPRIYASNWELSVHRATHVIRFLEEAGIAPERFEAVGMSTFNPIASNDTAEGKARNRRVDIYLIPER